MESNIETNLENIRICNDNKSNTVINIYLKNKNINHKLLNKYVSEIIDLGIGYELIQVKEGVLNGNN